MERRQDDDGRKAWENGATGAGCGGQHEGWPCVGIVGWEGASSVLTDTLCASGPEGRLLGARNTADGVYPGCGVEELRPG